MSLGSSSSCHPHPEARANRIPLECQTPSPQARRNRGPFSRAGLRAHFPIVLPGSPLASAVPRTRLLVLPGHSGRGVSVSSLHPGGSPPAPLPAGSLPPAPQPLTGRSCPGLHALHPSFPFTFLTGTQRLSPCLRHACPQSALFGKRGFPSLILVTGAHLSPPPGPSPGSLRRPVCSASVLV